MLVCARLQIREPIEFHALSPAAQDAWIQFVHDEWVGAFHPTAKPKQTPAEARAIEAEWLAQQRAKRGAA